MNRGRSARYRRGSLHYSPAVSLTPLIDTALTLLVVFMVAAPVAHYSVRVDLPKGSATEKGIHEQKTREMVISVDKSEQIFVDGVIVTRDAAIQMVTEAVKVQPNAVGIYFCFDRHAPCRVLELLEIVQSLEGVQFVALDFAPLR